MTELFPPQKPEYDRRVVLIIEYDGANYHGWQVQKNRENTVQAVLTDAVSKIANHDVLLRCAGRTDTGVHATRQIVHFDTMSKRTDYAWMSGINTKLPLNIRVQGAKETNFNFHARFAAEQRRYRYVIYNNSVAPGLFRRNMTWFRYPLNADLMHSAAQSFRGTHDFTTFRASNCQAHSPVRTVSQVSVKRYGKIIVMDIQADGFLYHMVRNIIGALLEIGQERKPVGWIPELLKLADRHKGGVTAVADGLYFVDAMYSAEFDLPKTEPGPYFLTQFLED